MGKPSAPTPPDPVATVNAQSQANSQSALQTAELNRVNQNTPYGSSTYTTNGTYPDGTPQYTQNVTLAPAQQQLLDLGNQGAISLGNTAVGMLGQVGNAYANPISTAGLPGVASQVSNQSTDAQIKAAQDAAYRSQTQYLDPQFSQSHEQLDNSLINQGITQGSEAYNNAQGNLGRTEQGAYQSARDAATTAGFGEQNTLYNQGLSSANLQNSAQAQGLSQLFALRNQPLNEYNALATGAQVTNPQFNSVPATNVATTDVAGIKNSAYQQQLAAYQQQMAGYNNLFGLAGSLGSAAILAPSDRRLKLDIKQISETGSGIPVYEFRYTFDNTRAKYIGVMADEVMHIPGATVLGDDGYYRVDYSRVI